MKNNCVDCNVVKILRDIEANRLKEEKCKKLLVKENIIITNHPKFNLLLPN